VSLNKINSSLCRANHPHLAPTRIRLDLPGSTFDSAMVVVVPCVCDADLVAPRVDLRIYAVELFLIMPSSLRLFVSKQSGTISHHAVIALSVARLAVCHPPRVLRLPSS
jgi:hypothetical protein